MLLFFVDAHLSRTIFGSQGSSLNMNLENFIEETKQSLRHCDECLSTSDLNANLETSNENTRGRKFLSNENRDFKAI